VVRLEEFTPYTGRSSGGEVERYWVPCVFRVVQVGEAAGAMKQHSKGRAECPSDLKSNIQVSLRWARWLLRDGAKESTRLRFEP